MREREREMHPNEMFAVKNVFCPKLGRNWQRSSSEMMKIS